MSERLLALERIVDDLRRELELIRPRLPVSSPVRRERTALTYDNGSYPTEPKGNMTVVRGIAEAGSTSTQIFLSSANTPFGPEASAIDGEYAGRTIRLVGGTGKGQEKTISAYVGASRRATISGTFSPVPDSTTQYSIEFVYPIIFLDGDEGRRQVAARVSGVQLGSKYLPPNTLVKAVEIEGRWFIELSSGEGAICVPVTTIPAASRGTQPGSDTFTPGVGDVYLLRWDDELGYLVPKLNPGGTFVRKRVLNLTTKVFRGGSPGSSSSGLGTIGGEGLVTLGGELLSTSIDIDAQTDIIFAKLNREGELILDGIEGTAAGTTKVAKSNSVITKLDAGTNTPGSGPVTVWEFSGLSLVATAEILTAYNWTDYDCPGSEFILIHQEQASGNWVLVMDGQQTIQDGADTQEILYPYDTLLIDGDRDASGGALGDIIETRVSKAGDIVTMLVRAAGDMFRFADEDDPQAFEIVSLAETIQLASNIDESQVSKFAEWRATASTMTIWFGKVFDVTDDASPTPGDADIFPLETFKFAAAGGLSATVAKAGDIVTVTYTGAGAGNFDIEDERPSPQTITVNTGDTLKLDSLIDEVGLPTTFSEFRVTAGAPELLQLAFGRMFSVEDGDLDIQSLFPSESVQFRGDRDVAVAVGNIIETEVTKAGDRIIVDVNATGTMFRIVDNQASPVTVNVDLGDDWSFDTSIDETQLTQWAIWKASQIVTNPDLELVFGKLLTVSDNASPSPASSNIFPLEEITFAGAGGVTTAVTKAADEVTVTITGSGAGNFTIQDEQPSPQTITVNVGDTVLLDTLIDEAGLPNTFSEFRVSAGAPENLKLAFGKVLSVEDDQASPNERTLFPLEKLKFDGPGTGYYTVSKVGDVVTVTSSGAGSFTIEDDRASPQSIVISSGETLKLDAKIDETMTTIWSEFRAIAGAPELLELVFGKLLQIDGFSTGVDGTANIFPLEILKVQGDRDQSAVLGNIIDVQISKAADTVTVDINATGDLFQFQDERVSPGFVVVGLGETITNTSVIDETMTDKFSEWRHAGNDQRIVFGLMLQVEDDQASPNTVNMFPTEKLKFDQTGSAGFTVSKLGDTVTVALAPGAGGGSFTVTDERPSPQSIVVDGGDTVLLDTVVDKVGLPTTWTEFRCNAGAPEEIELAFGAMLQIRGFSPGVDGSATLFPTENLDFVGDKDENNILGNFIDVQVSKVGSTVTVNIAANGDMFDIETDTSSVRVSTGDVITFSDTIDEAGLPNTFLEIRGSGNNVIWAFGQLFRVQDGDLDSQTVFPVEDFQIRGDRDVSPVVGNFIETEVTKSGDRVIITVNAVGSMFTIVDNKSPQASAPVDAGDQVFLLSSIDETMTTKHFEWRVSEAFGNVLVASVFGKVMDVAGDSGTANLFPLERLHIQSVNPSGRVTVAKVGDDADVTINLAGVALPVGSIIENSRAPVSSGGKLYMNNGSGGADTNWAFMDGTSNLGPGSGQDRRNYFVKGHGSGASLNNDAFGRAGAALTDTDEVRVQVSAHPDHIHTITPDQCHGDVPSPDTHFDFSVITARPTGIQLQTNQAPLTLDHTIVLTNNQGTQSPTGQHIRMLPPYKKTNWFERVA